MVVVLVVIVVVFAAVAVWAVLAARRARRAQVAAEADTHAAQAAAQAAAEAASQQATEAAASAQAAVDAANDRATAAADQAAADIERMHRQVAWFDADVLWALERRRTDRTWRVSVAPSPEVPSGLAEAPHPLVAALRIETDAMHEEVGTVIELDAVIPDGITAAASVLTLRVVQELLAAVVREAEQTVVRIRVEGADVVITVEAVDENGAPVAVPDLGLPTSASVEQTEQGAILHVDAVQP